MTEQHEPSDLPRHFPYEEEAKILTDIFGLFAEKLPHLVQHIIDDIDEGLMSRDLYEQLSALSDETLKQAGLERADIPKLVAAIVEFAHLAAKSKNNRNS